MTGLRHGVVTNRNKPNPCFVGDDEGGGACQPCHYYLCRSTTLEANGSTSLEANGSTARWPSWPLVVVGAFCSHQCSMACALSVIIHQYITQYFTPSARDISDRANIYIYMPLPIAQALVSIPRRIYCRRCLVPLCMGIGGICE